MRPHTQPRPKPKSSDAEQLLQAVNSIVQRRGVGSDPGLILKQMLLLFTQPINAPFTRRRSPAVERAGVQGRGAGFQVGKTFLSATPPFPHPFIKHTLGIGV